MAELLWLPVMAGHILDSLCPCKPTLYTDGQGETVWIHHFSGANETVFHEVTDVHPSKLTFRAQAEAACEEPV